MKIKIQIHNEKSFDVPSKKLFEQWAETAFSLALNNIQEAEIGLNIANESSMQLLNDQFRQKNQPTNILSFPYEIDEEDKIPCLGDLIICAPVIEKEAIEQGVDLTAHWAHIFIHGCLHLIGYDHLHEEDAAKMESLEAKILETLSFKNPYA